MSRSPEVIHILITDVLPYSASFNFGLALLQFNIRK